MRKPNLLKDNTPQEDKVKWIIYGHNGRDCGKGDNTIFVTEVDNGLQGTPTF